MESDPQPAAGARRSHDRRRLDHVHPQHWINPEPAERYHLVVIGAGTAGLVSAAIAASLGARVALVERHLMGGDCLNVGCVPSKAVIRAARAWHDARRAAEDFGGPAVDAGSADFAAAMERMRRLRADFSSADGAARFRDLGVDVFLGQGRFVAADEVEVEPAGSDDQGHDAPHSPAHNPAHGPARLSFRKAFIATGGRPEVPPVPGLDGVRYLTHESVFDLEELPPRLGVLGAGPVGCELAQAFARMGAEVHVLDRNDRPLHRQDTDASAVLRRSMERDGVTFHLGVDVRRVTEDDSFGIEVERGEDRWRIEVDELLVAAGRTANVEGLGLEAAGVAYGPGGVEVDARMRTSNRKIFALGDVASEQKFTHLADFQARVAVRNALFFGRGRAADLVVPGCTYTSPEIAHVGLDRAAAEAEGRGVEEMTVSMGEVDRAVLDGQSEGFLRLLLEPGSDRILGATLVAEHAGDLMGPLCLAVTHDIGLSRFSETMFPYPTQAEIFRKAGDQYNRRKLTPWVRALFRAWFRVFT